MKIVHGGVILKYFNIQEDTGLLYRVLNQHLFKSRSRELMDPDSDL
jgi:hypothetical protein